jgi:hypothetical protein
MENAMNNGSTSRLFSSLVAIGINPKMQTFAERKRVQKTVYLLDKVFEMNFGYPYSWYLHGPYSPYVTQIVFDVLEGRESTDANPTTLSNEDLAKIERMRTFLGPDLLSNDTLELLVSVHFLLSCGRNTDRQIIEFLNEKKPYFSNEQIILAIHRIRNLTNQ